MIFVIATFIVRPEKRADYLENVRHVIAATRREEGCLTYDLTSSVTEPNEFIFVERWTTRDALAAHFESAHIREWRKLAAEYVERGKVEIITPDHIEER